MKKRYKKNHQVLVIATSRRTRGGITSVVNSHTEGSQWDKFNCIWIESTRDGNSLRKVWYILKSLFSFFLYVPMCDIIHVHSALGTSLIRKNIYITLGKLFNKKIIIHLHAADPELLNNPVLLPKYRKIFQKADIVITLSNSWKAVVKNRLQVEGNRIEVIYNPAPLVKRSACNQKNILFAGTLIKRKGYDTLLRAFAMITKSSDIGDWKLLLAGNGEIEEAKELAKSLGIINRVEFLGWIRGNEKETAFQSSSIFCLPSLAEGFPMAVLDAWAYGIPCILTPVGGIPEIVQDKTDGIIVPVSNEYKLAEALKSLIQSPDKRESIVKSTDRKIKEEFSLNSVANKLTVIYNRLIQKTNE